MYIATLAAMDGSRAHRRTFVTALATLALAALALAPAGAAQSAGDDQYSDPLAGDRQQEPSSRGGGEPSDAPAPAPAPAAPTGPDTPTSDGGTADATAAAPQTGESLPRTGAEPVPIAAAGTALLLAGALLRRLVLRRATA